MISYFLVWFSADFKVSCFIPCTIPCFVQRVHTSRWCCRLQPNPKTTTGILSWYLATGMRILSRTTSFGTIHWVGVDRCCFLYTISYPVAQFELSVSWCSRQFEPMSIPVVYLKTRRPLLIVSLPRYRVLNGYAWRDTFQSSCWAVIPTDAERPCRALCSIRKVAWTSTTAPAMP